MGRNKRAGFAGGKKAVDNWEDRGWKYFRISCESCD